MLLDSLLHLSILECVRGNINCSGLVQLSGQLNCIVALAAPTPAGNQNQLFWHSSIILHSQVFGSNFQKSLNPLPFISPTIIRNGPLCVTMATVFTPLRLSNFLRNLITRLWSIIGVSPSVAPHLIGS